MAPETTDMRPYAPRSVVADPFFDWAGDRRPRTVLSDTVIYEAHVKGATYRHPDIEPELRGTYSGIAHPAFLEHLRRLGITAIELMPVHQFVHDARLVDGRPAQLLGLQLDRLLRAARRVRARARVSASRCRSSSRWSARSTRRASR